MYNLCNYWITPDLLLNIHQIIRTMIKLLYSHLFIESWTDNIHDSFKFIIKAYLVASYDPKNHTGSLQALMGFPYILNVFRPNPMPNNQWFTALFGIGLIYSTLI